jgi:hypothetical protein
VEYPVLLALPRSRDVLDTVLAQWRGEPTLPRFPIPDQFRFDRDFPIVPMGRVPGAGLGLPPSPDPLLAEQFVVRGSIEAASPEEIPETLDGRLVLADPQVDVYSTCFTDAAIGTADDVASRLDLAALHAAGLDGEGVAIGIVDTGINLDFLEGKLGKRPAFDPAYSWKPPGSAVDPGHFPRGHGTMCAYAALLAAPKATLLDIPALIGTPAGGAPIGARISTVYVAVSGLVAQALIALPATGQPKYRAIVLSNSWGMYHPSWDFPAGHPGRYSDNPQHPFTATLKVLSINNVDIVFAAGNCGAECPDDRCQNVFAQSITGANASSEFLTVTGCDLNDRRAGYASRGPGIAGMATEKPDVAAYTHYAGSGALGDGVPDKGTSAACPLVAGIVGALRTQVPGQQVSPSALNKVLRDSARGAANGWNGETGFGIVDPAEAARRLGLI